MKDKVKFKQRSTNLGIVSVPALCFSFLLLGFFGANLFSQDGSKDGLESIGSVMEETESMRHGDTGDDIVSKIPFQVLSWKPRALYFPNFGTPEQCDSTVNSARPFVRPSKLALRRGDVSEKAKKSRTSSGVFITASQHETLDYVERKKIAKVTMVPRDHGEAFNVLRYEIGQKYDAHYEYPTEPATC